MKNNLKKSLDGIYDFMSNAYYGNWQYRWDQTPYLQKNIKRGKNESILAHQWACIGFWFYLSRICPSLAKLVSTTEIYERLLFHDLGETFEGDISQFLQMQGRGVGKHKTERKEVKKISKTILKKMQRELLKHFDEFEEDFVNMKKLEVIISKFIDLLQGNHFALVFGNNLKGNSEIISKIVNKRFMKIADRLLEVLKKGGHKEAYQEVVGVIKHHLESTKKAGIKINKLKSLLKTIL